MTDLLLDRIRKLERSIDSIRQIGDRLSSTLNIDNLLHLIIKEMTVLMNAERSTLFIVDHNSLEIWSKIAEKSEIKEIRQKIGVGISGWVADRGEILNIPDVYKDPRFDSSTDKKTGFVTRSVLTAPIYSPSFRVGDKGPVIAVIQVLNKKTGSPFDKDDENLIELLASQISVSLMNAKLYHSLENKVKELNFLYDIEKNVNQTSNLDEVINQVTNRLVEYLNVEAGSIILKNDEKKYLYFKVATGPHAEYLQSLQLRLDHGIVGWVIQNRVSVKIDDVSSDSRFNSEIAEKINFLPNSIIAVPLISNNQAIGVIEMINKLDPTQKFKKSDLQVLEIIGGQVTRIIETIMEREKMAKEERLASIGNMMSTIVHDIRSPMTSIQGFVDLLRNSDLNEDERKEYADIVINQIHNMVYMTNEILDFAKGKTSILPRKTGVKDLFDEYIQLVSNDLRAQAVEFVTRFEVNSKVIYVDKAKLLRVFLNLQKNAVEAMDKDIRLFEFSVFESPIEEICFSFKDNGKGVPENIKDRLFESFVSSGKENGTGLGLAIVKKIIDEHKGRIELNSNSQGTEIKIYFKEYHG